MLDECSSNTPPVSGQIARGRVSMSALTFFEAGVVVPGYSTLIRCWAASAREDPGAPRQLVEILEVLESARPVAAFSATPFTLVPHALTVDDASAASGAPSDPCKGPMGRGSGNN